LGDPFSEPKLGNIVPSVFTPVLAKHSKSFSLVDYVSVGVDRMERNFEPMGKQVEAEEERNQRSVPEFDVYLPVRFSTVTSRDTKCHGNCRSMSPEECTATTQLIFLDRGMGAYTCGMFGLRAFSAP
jgi:hypothetical protein